ncbi:MAG: multidrug efflux SMR transporter [Methanomethylophilus sp.]
MYSAYAMTCIIIAGLLEPVWVITLKKSESFHRPLWGVATVIFAIASPFCMSLSLSEIPVGTAYAIWTGIGAVCTIIVGRLLFSEGICRRQLLFLTMIIFGVVGLSLTGSGA